jgi:phosphoglucosamine mutase
MWESALEAGFASAGVGVLLTGPLPTPGVAYLTRALRVDLGVVISASHNPFEDNGIKFFSARGEKLPDAWEEAVERELGHDPVWVSSSGLGRAKRLADAQGRYVEFCKSTVSGDLSLKGLKLIVDAANGAAYQVAPAVFHELGAEVVSMGCAPDGLNINEACGATAPAAAVAAVVKNGADFGIALDGDADRLQFIDGQGRLYDGDQLLYVLAQDRLSQGERLSGVVGTLMTNIGVERALKGLGVDLVRAKVGDRHVLEELTRRGWVLGGEGSGHLLALDRHSTGDGIVSAVQVLQAVLRSGQPLATLLSAVKLFPQRLLNVRLSGSFDWRTSEQFQSELLAVGAALEGRGRVLVRESGTEPVLRIMVESDDGATSDAHAARLAVAARAQS